MSRSGGDPSHVASVASFFVSRIDSAVDKQLDEKIAKANDPTEKERLRRSRARSRSPTPSSPIRTTSGCFPARAGERLAAKGAKPQRLLWASTGTKNKDYSDVLYVEELIGPTPSTPCHRRRSTHFAIMASHVTALRKMSRRPSTSLQNSISPASRSMRSRPNWSRTASKQFADAADKLYGAVAHKRAASLGGGIDRQQLALGSAIGSAVEKSSGGLAGIRHDPPPMAARQVGLDRDRREQVAGLAHERRRRPMSRTMKTSRTR